MTTKAPFNEALARASVELMRHSATLATMAVETARDAQAHLAADRMSDFWQSMGEAKAYQAASEKVRDVARKMGEDAGI